MKRRSFIGAVLASLASPFILVPRFYDAHKWKRETPTSIYVPSEWTHMVIIPGTGGMMRWFKFCQPHENCNGHWLAGPVTNTDNSGFTPVVNWNDFPVSLKGDFIYDHRPEPPEVLVDFSSLITPI